MCGIVGITSTSLDVNKKLYKGLLALQHRGQDSAGLVIASNGLEFLGDHGHAGDIFDFNNPFFSKKSEIGIGHVRYTTSGSGVLDANIQPTVGNSIALSYNGNITNVKCDDKSDVFFFLNILENADSLEEGVEEIFAKAKGGYAIVGMTEGKMFGFRDPRGIRPLVLGASPVNSGWALASESCAFDVMGYSLLRDVKPGELIVIHKGGMIGCCSLQESNPAPCMFEQVYFGRPDSIIDDKNVSVSRRELGYKLAEKIKNLNINPDVVIGVPESGRLAAIAIAEKLNISYREGFIKNQYIQRSFILSSDEQRKEVINQKLSVIQETVKDKKVLVVDDSIVRGNTSKKIVSKIRNAGADKIYFVSACPPVRYPCFYGIAFPTKEELLANDRSLYEINKLIGADKTIYINNDDLKAVVGNKICDGCITNSYPV